MSTERTPQLVYRVTPERRRQIREWAAKHDTTIQAMFEEALEILLNPAAESTEITVEEFTPKRHKLVHNYPVGDSPLWVEMILTSGDEDSISGLIKNIKGFLADLALLAMEMEARTGVAHAPYPNAADYTAAVRAARNTLAELRQYFEDQRKKTRRTSSRSTP